MSHTAALKQQLELLHFYMDKEGTDRNSEVFRHVLDCLVAEAEGLIWIMEDLEK